MKPSRNNAGIGPFARFAVAPMVVGLLCIVPNAWGSDAPFVFNGHITAGSPAAFFGLGVTELGSAPCDTESPLNGIDGWWFSTAGYVGERFVVTVDPLLDADASFYTDACRIVNFAGGAQNLLGAPEGGYVPATAAFVLVVGSLGTGNFTLYLG